MNKQDLRENIKHLIDSQKLIEDRLKELASQLYKKETGEDFHYGYKRALRELGFVI